MDEILVVMEKLKKLIGKRVRFTVLTPTKIDWDYINEEANTPLPAEMLEPTSKEVDGVVEEVRADGMVVLDCGSYYVGNVRNIQEVSQNSQKD